MFKKAIFVACVAAIGSSFGQIGVFDVAQDVGSVGVKGSTTYDNATGDYTINGSGTNMYHLDDQFHFVYKKMVGNFVARARCKGYTPRGTTLPNDDCKAGWMARKALTNNSAWVGTGLHKKGLVSILLRPENNFETGEVKDSTVITNSVPNITQLERKGNLYIMGLGVEGSVMHYDTLDTVPWPSSVPDPFGVGKKLPVRLGDTVFLGLFVCSKNNQVAETYTFDSVTISGPTSIAPLFSVIQPTFSISVQSLIHNPELFSSITVVNGMGQDIIAGEPALFSSMIKRLGSGIYYVKARTLNGGTYNLKFVQR
jgi:TolB protein